MGRHVSQVPCGIAIGSRQKVRMQDTVSAQGADGSTATGENPRTMYRTGGGLDRRASFSANLLVISTSVPYFHVYLLADAAQPQLVLQNPNARSGLIVLCRQFVALPGYTVTNHRLPRALRAGYDEFQLHVTSRPLGSAGWNFCGVVELPRRGSKFRRRARIPNGGD